MNTSLYRGFKAFLWLATLTCVIVLWVLHSKTPEKDDSKTQTHVSNKNDAKIPTQPIFKEMAISISEAIKIKKTVQKLINSIPQTAIGDPQSKLNLDELEKLIKLLDELDSQYQNALLKLPAIYKDQIAANLYELIPEKNTLPFAPSDSNENFQNKMTSFFNMEDHKLFLEKGRRELASFQEKINSAKTALNKKLNEKKDVDNPDEKSPWANMVFYKGKLKKAVRDSVLDEALKGKESAIEKIIEFLLIGNNCEEEFKAKLTERFAGAEFWLKKLPSKKIKAIFKKARKRRQKELKDNLEYKRLFNELIKHCKTNGK